jgi:transposase-like protein
MEKFTYQQFEAQFQDEETCLEIIFQNRFGDLKECPSCKGTAGFHRISDRKCYACQWCGYQIHPLAGTIFHKSKTKLKTWFYAIWLFSNSKNGVSAKELQRLVGVTYKTAFRMGHQIRLLCVATQKQLEGTVEVDETYYGGLEKNKHLVDRVGGTQGRSVKSKTPILGMVQRDGEVIAQVVARNDESTVRPILRQNVKIGTKVMTDEWLSYNRIKDDGFKHKRINHGKKEYVRGNVHTNTIEGFWSQLKRSINGTYHCVSPRHLQSYVNEFSFRYGKRNLERPLFYPMISLAGMPVL